jgi:Ca-activated chloride channel homolog
MPAAASAADSRKISLDRLSQRIGIPRFRLRKTLLILGASVSIFSMVALPATAQGINQQAHPEPEPQVKVSAALVKVDVSVVDRKDNFLGDLERKDFRVFDNDTEEPISYFASADAPAQVLVLVEASPAVFLIHRQHLDAAYALLNGLGASDSVALAKYAEQPDLILPFTTDKNQLARQLTGLQYQLGSGDLNFYDSVHSCLDWLSGFPEKKALILLTTGLDSSPEGHWESLEKRVRGSDVTIFPVALGGSLRSYMGSPSAVPGSANGSSAANLPGLSFQAADRALHVLADLSGGEAFFPKQDKEFTGIYQRIAAALRHQYTLGFAPARDGKFHSIRIEVLDDKGKPLLTDGSKKRYRIFARQGYEAPGPED